MELLLGKPLAQTLLSDLKKRITASGTVPGLAVLLIGNNPASEMYVGLKQKAAEEIGMYFEKHLFSERSSEEDIVGKIDELNHDPKIHGIIVQLPLPEGLDEARIVSAILPEKDADGFHPRTLERYFAGDPLFQPVFPRAVARLIQSAGVKLAGEQAIVVANSLFFGRVMGETLRNLDLHPRIIERENWERERDFLKEAKVIVTACGEPGLVRGELLTPGVIIIDGGITRVGEKVLGDVDRTSVEPLSGYLAPVPGGVGPLTVASLLERVVESALHPAAAEGGV